MQISTCVQCEIVHCCLLCFELSIAAATGVHFKNQSGFRKCAIRAVSNYYVIRTYSLLSFHFNNSNKGIPAGITVACTAVPVTVYCCFIDIF